MLDTHEHHSEDEAEASRRRRRLLRAAEQALPSPPETFFTLHQGDARRLELHLGRYSSEDHPLLTTTITSPPYAGLKDYGHPSQIGRGQPYDEYLIDLRRIFRALAKHTKPDGSLWVIADTLRPRGPELRRLQALPFDLAEQAEQVGWTLRDVIIWDKQKSLPWSSPGRLRNTFEYVLYFVRGPRFKYRIDRLREPVNLKEWWVKYPERYNPEGKVPTNVWSIPIPVQGSWANTAIQHACPLPPDLVERLVLLSTEPEDVVFDPFAGSGVVVAEATRLNRRGIGIELVPEYLELYEKAVLPEIKTRRGLDQLAIQQEQRRRLQRTILTLRIVKLPRAVIRQLDKDKPHLTRPRLALVLEDKRSRPHPRHVLARVRLVLFFNADDEGMDDYVRQAVAAMRRKPLSKFGLEATVEWAPLNDLSSFTRGRRVYGYSDGRTWKSDGPVSASVLIQRAVAGATDRYPPIASNLHVDEPPRALNGSFNLDELGGVVEHDVTGSADLAAGSENGR